MKTIVCFVAAVVTAACTPVLAQTYPARSIRIVVPFAPGGSTDILSRTVALKLTEAWKQQVIADNRPGANGIIGADLVAKSPPDGYNLVMASIGTHATNASLYAKMPYDTIRDFTPVSLVAIVELVLVVHPSLPVHSVKDLIALAKAKPGALNYASGGQGASQHLAAELFKHMTGVNMVHVPYKGSAPALPDLLSGHVPIMFADLPLVTAHIQSGKLRALAVAGKKRNAVLPNVPTVAEAAVPGYYAFAWYGLFAPAGTPGDIINKLNAEVVRILRLPDVQERLRGLGADPIGSTPEEFREFQRSEMERWARVIKAANIRVE
ncbi:MAG: tripartite tricarboxylate transporter substrate binding protein [Burkholderiales bacterium]|nr:tripartite tricarboxylate transporter substrate binding protein [Burkholderiales bacterium]